MFLGEEEVFKVKKPVDFGFLDFSSLDKRRAACEAEVRLNRRLAPDVYLGLVPVTRDADGKHHLGDKGEIVDWAVHMKRLPDADRADFRLRAGRLSAAHLDSLARTLARFHASSPSTGEEGGLDTVRFNVEENFEQTRERIGEYLEPEQVRELESWQRRFLERNEELFERRVHEGRVRDGHGDLRLEHVYMDDAERISVIDCIEFNERFRYQDICADVVFLAMDLAFHGRVDLAERFLADYARAANDYDLYPLVDFYESYRAFVRGKIASFGDKSEEARRYFLLALASERRSLLPPSVVAVGGLIAAGKSTVAERVGSAMGAPVIDADRTRKFLAGLEPEEHALEGAFEGVYSREFTEKVYQEILRRAEAVLASARPVVLDASFRSREHRDAVRELASRRQVPFYFVECRAPEELLRKRLAEREPGVSDGRLAIFDSFVASFEPVLEIPSSEHIALDTSLPVPENDRFLRERLPVWPKSFRG